MNQRTVETLAGVFLLIGLVVIAILAGRIGGGLGWGRSGYELQASFASVAGLKAGSRVEIGGVRIGEVRRLVLRPEDFRSIVTFTVPHDIVLDDDTIAAVRTHGLLGDKTLVLIPGGSGVPLKPGDLIVDTESAVDIESLVRRFAFGGVGPDAAATP